jgi:uncharacterized membrane protein
MKSVKVGKASLIAMMMFAAVFASGSASAATIGDIARNIKESLTGVLDLVYVGAYLGGAICALLAAFKLKAHSDNPQQNPMKTPVILFIVCAILIALPSFMDSSSETVWNGAEQSSADRAGIAK